LRGALPHNEAVKDIARAQVVIVPSLVDNLPYTVIESMQMGRVVLASKQGGQSEIINDGVNGFLFDHNIEDSFEKRLRHILELSTEEHTKIGEQAKRTINDVFNEIAIYNKKINLLNEVLDQKSGRHFPFTRLNQAAERIREQHTDQPALVSVVIPYYNLPDYVEETVTSVLRSTYKHVEIVIVDDGSTVAGSRKVLERLSKIPQVKVFSKINEG